MKAAGIGPGCYVLIHAGSSINPGDIGLYLVDGKKYIRYCAEAPPDTIILNTANPENPPEVFAGEDLKRVHGVGPCTATMQMLPRGPAVNK